MKLTPAPSPAPACLGYAYACVCLASKVFNHRVHFGNADGQYRLKYRRAADTSGPFPGVAVVESNLSLYYSIYLRESH